MRGHQDDSARDAGSPELGILRTAVGRSSDRLVRSLLFRRVRAAVGRRIARSSSVAGPCAGLPALLNGPVRIANWLACPLRLRAPAIDDRQGWAGLISAPLTAMCPDPRATRRNRV